MPMEGRVKFHNPKNISWESKQKSIVAFSKQLKLMGTSFKTLKKATKKKREKREK